ncbi:MAG: hypothetical protein J0I84_15705 [Terrimonas sp.]|nr:hypothetical protein [Terrimonas sp.]OJY92186.1 MAG: hypothetical protein BGP13_08465 [Sphingobacteriales bacterium 40-81]
MKPVLMVFMLMALSKGYAQNNQIKLYIQQIAANKVYLEYLQKGYSIVKNGLNTIGNIKNGHFSLDKDFFSQLENINPKVRHYAKEADIIALNVQIIRRFKKALAEAKGTDLFSDQELDYINRVFNSLIDNCASLTDELTVLLTPSEWKMSDDERIKRIDGLHTAMRDNYAFVNHFAGELEIMAMQKGKELNDAAVLQGLYKK